MSDPIWFTDPEILFSKTSWTKFVPMQGMTTAESLNAVVRFSIYFSLVLFAATGISSYILAIPIVMVATIMLYNLFPNGTTLESFTVRPVKQTGKYHMPTKENPFMNVLLTDDNNREDAAPTNRKDVKAKIYNEFAKTSDIYMDTSDLFDQSLAMRTFHTLQSSKRPNDQDAFLQWLAKGFDTPDYSSAAPARGGKILSEGYVSQKGSMPSLLSTTAKPTGTSPTTADK